MISCRHGRACTGHPCTIAASARRRRVDARIKSAHDGDATVIASA
jgi:hypothetical protein